MSKRVCFWFMGLLAIAALPAQAATVSFTALSGLVGGTPAATAVFKADLSTLGLGSILSISVADNSSGLGGATGQFSGFDLDAIKLSTTDCADAACAAGAGFFAVFNFAGGTFFSPGTQRAPVDPKLFGTNGAGTAVDNAVATLGVFDGNSTTGPTAFGFISMGDNGTLTFNLTGAVSTTGLFLYIGEVGDNGEVAAGRITVSDVPVPEPASMVLMGTGLAVLRGVIRRRTTPRRTA